MDSPLFHDIVKSIEDYTKIIEKFNSEHPITTFFWKPSRVRYFPFEDGADCGKLSFDIVDVDDNAIIGQTCINVSKCGPNIVLYFLITDFKNSATFNILYDDTVYNSIGQYIYSFVREVDMLMNRHQERYDNS